MKLGYIRISSDTQAPDVQLDALRVAGCERIFTDTAHVSKKGRPSFEEALAYARTGDVLVVWKLDRIGHSLRHLVRTIQLLQSKGVHVRSLMEKIETETPSGRSVAHIFAALAQFEADLIRERTISALPALQARGRKGGRPGLTPDRIKAVQTLWGQPGMTADVIAAKLGIGRRTVFKYVQAKPE